LNYVDYIIILVVAVGFILGFKDGLVRKIIGLLGLILGIVFALTFSDELGEFISPMLNHELYLAEIAAGIVIFIITIFIASVLKRVIHPLDKVNKFFNQILGGITGSLQIIYLISGFLLFLNIFKIPSAEARDESLLYQKAAAIIPYSIEFVMGSNSKAEDFIKDFIEEKDSSVIDTTQSDD